MTLKTRKFVLARLVLALGMTLAGAVWPGVGRSAAEQGAAPAGAGPVLSYPIMFVTQVPVAADFTTIGSTFGNHQARLSTVARGGDLWIRYPDGALKNLTEAAGFGGSGVLSGSQGIAVRDPAVHWNGTKAIFSMVVGVPTARYQVNNYYWQLYEITGFGQGQTPVITKVPNQPANYNNVSPIYGTDDRIIFTTDRPRNGSALLYPQIDEYEEAPTNTGLWSLNPATGDLRLLNHAPSGNFSPFIDSYGRVVFTQWDHLQRDQQADADADSPDDPPYGTFNYASETSSSYNPDDRTEIFPETRDGVEVLTDGTQLAGHTINHFFPWTITQDGRDGEILNHLGRQELHSYIGARFEPNEDPNVFEYYGQFNRTNPHNRSILNMFQIAEDPLRPGAYYGVDAPEFGTHAAGQVISLTAQPSLHASDIVVSYVTHRATAGTTNGANHSGHYREPVPLAGGQLIAAHTPYAGYESSGGTASSYHFRLKTLAPAGNGLWTAGQALTPGIQKTVSYWDPDNMLSFSGELWELNPVEVRPVSRPPWLPASLPAPEQAVFNQAGVLSSDLQIYLRQNGLALAVTRNVTTRDALDVQQPFNLRVGITGTQTIGAAGPMYSVSFMQFFQADQLRGLTFGGGSPRAGRRVLAQVMHDPAALAANPPSVAGPGSVVVAPDGSAAAFVPARRALTWQLTDAAGEGVVLERYWVTFQPGEIRVCTSCHGPSALDQAGHTPPQNPPQALLTLLEYWKANNATSYERVWVPHVGR